MTKVDFVNGITRSVNKAGLLAKKYSPEILLAGGIVGVVAGAVLACKATTKVGAILEETKAQVEGIHKVMEDPDLKNRYLEKYGDEFTEEEGKKELAIVYVQTGMELAKLYAPALSVGALAITSILVSHRIIHQRNLALAAAYTAVDTSFKDYRKRLVERFGKELDRELRYNLKSQEVEEVVTDEKGETKVVKSYVETYDPNTISEYARVYDDGCRGWTKSAEDNLRFLKIQQSLANEKLKRRGYLFLNEVYDMLGIPHSRAGHIAGWFYDPKNCDYEGDDFVDFGIYNLDRERNREFINGKERVILLEFNVVGNVYDLVYPR